MRLLCLILPFYLSALQLNSPQYAQGILKNENCLCGGKAFGIVCNLCFRYGSPLNLTEREGFEPSVRDKRTHAFQACSLNRSDISPKLTENSLEKR